MIRQYSNRNEAVYSPFMGIGSEGVVALRHGRRFIGTELKPAYYKQAVRHLTDAEQFGTSGDLFSKVAG
jgi:DNA modification methylase